MKSHSTKNTWSASDGTRYTSAQVEEKIRHAKAKKLQEMIEEHEYIFCEDCKGNHPGEFIDCSHDKSVDWCKKNGCVELAWDVNNITIRGRSCHQKLDKLK